MLGSVVDDVSRWLRACVSQLLGVLRRLQVLRTAALAIRPLRRLRVSFVCGFEVSANARTSSKSRRCGTVNSDGVIGRWSQYIIPLFRLVAMS